jgi:hypothetical protein
MYEERETLKYQKLTVLKRFAVLAALVAVGMAANAAVDFSINFSQTTAGMGSGQIAATANGNGSYTALSGTIDVGSGGVLPSGEYGLVPLFGGYTYPFSSGQYPTVRFPGGGNLQFDDQVNSGSPSPDYWGLLFANQSPTGSDQNSGSGFILWVDPSNGAEWVSVAGIPNPNGGYYGGADYPGASITMNLVAVPEPVTTATFGGIAALGMLLVPLRRKLSLGG